MTPPHSDCTYSFSSGWLHACRWCAFFPKGYCPAFCFPLSNVDFPLKEQCPLCKTVCQKKKTVLVYLYKNKPGRKSDESLAISNQTEYLNNLYDYKLGSLLGIQCYCQYFWHMSWISDLSLALCSPRQVTIMHLSSYKKYLLFLLLMHPHSKYKVYQVRCNPILLYPKKEYHCLCVDGVLYEINPF